jgi:hypothetical protein
MGRHAVIYVVAMAVVGAVAMLMSVDGIAIVVLFLTLGLGIPLIFAATLLPYMACFLPVVLALPRKGTALAALPLSIALAAAWWTLPNWQSMRQAEATAAALTAQDIVPPSPVAARGFELRRKRSFQYGMGSQVLPEEPCSAFCRSLLIGGEADWVRIVMTDADKDKGSTFYGTGNATLYVAASGAGCASPGDPVHEDARCVVFAPDHGEPAGLVAEITESTGIKRLKLGVGTLFRPTGERVVTMQQRRDGGPVEVLRHTELQLGVIMKGSVLGPRFFGMGSGGLEFVRTSRQFNKADFFALLRSAGYKLADIPEAKPADGQTPSWRDPPGADLSRQVASLLDMPGEAPFNAEQSRAVGDWIMHARSYKEWPPERIDLLRRIVRDERVTYAAFFDQVFSRNPKLSAALMPDVLGRIEVMGEERNLDPGYEGALAMQYIDPAILTPHASRILPLVTRPGRVGEVMINAVGRVGVDPAPYLQPMRKEEDGRVIGSKAHAACLAEAKWGPSLVPMLRALVTEQELARPRAEIESVLKALLRHGDTAFVEQSIAASKWEGGTASEPSAARPENSGRHRSRLLNRFFRKTRQAAPVPRENPARPAACERACAAGRRGGASAWSGYGRRRR